MPVKLRRGRVLDADSVMPLTPVHQRHESPRTGDAIGAIRRAAGGFLDLNVVIMCGILWALHWTTPIRGGFRWVVDLRTGRIRRMRPRELFRRGDKWGVDGVKRWRRKVSKRRGGGWEEPLTLDEALGECVRLGTCAIIETKSRAFATDARWYEEIARLCRKHDHPRWTKALATMWGIRGKVVLAAAAGVYLAVIYGKGIRGRVRRLARTRAISRSWTVKPYATW